MVDFVRSRHDRDPVPWIAGAVSCGLLIAFGYFAWTQQKQNKPNELQTLERTDTEKPAGSLGVSPPLEPVEKPAVDFHKRLQLATVRITDPQQGVLGSGTIVSRSSTGFDVLTANHIVEGQDSYVVMFGEASEQDVTFRVHVARIGKVVARDPIADLAYLRVRSANPQVGVVVLRVGNLGDKDKSEGFVATGIAWESDFQPLGKAIRIEGRIKARRTELDSPVSFWRSSEQSQKGASGSGLLDDSGHLIGIASGNGSGSSFYLDDKELRKFYRKAGL